MMFFFFFLLFFFKQKTAYEIYQCDWSSDVCSSDLFDVESVDGWKYWLYDMTNKVYVESGTFFTPNSSITAVRWGNLLTVSALSTSGEWVNKSVIFDVNVPDSAPILGYIDNPIFVCEGKSLKYAFNATDVDYDDLTGDIVPKNPFYLEIGRASCRERV